MKRNWVVKYSSLTVLAGGLVLIYMSGKREWLGRLAAVAFLLILIIGLSLGSSLNPHVRYIRGGKLAEPGRERARGVAERVIRSLAFAFGVFFTFQIGIPFVQDCAELIRTRQLTTITGVAARVNYFPLVRQQVNLFREGATELRSYTMFFVWRPFRMGETLRLTVLPRSRLILQANDPEQR